MYNRVLSRVCQKVYKKFGINVWKNKKYVNCYLIYLLFVWFVCFIWIRKLVLKEFCMLCVLCKRQEREVLKWCGVKRYMLYRGANFKVDPSG